MQQLLNVWMNLDIRRQITVVVATVAMFLAILMMSRLATAPSMTLLYAGMESGAAGEVIRSLEQRGVTFEVRGGSIFVDSKDRDQLRMTLASEGLPANSTRGYELLDNLTGFGTTSQMFDAAYWRAKEGELARTIVSSPHIAQARVHIASSGSNPFQRNVSPTASVAVTPNGAGLSAQHAKAIRFLIASAVAGLSPDDVAVIDANGALIGTTEESAPTAGADDKAALLRERVERLLAARVGAGNSVVEVSVDTVTETEEIRERRFDPASRVAISTDTEERTSNSNEAGGGEVTVASNLPDGDASGGDTASSQNSETRERVNYEVSETEREVVRAAGAIKRVTVAVLVNNSVTTDSEGRLQTAPRSEEEMQSLKELVASAIGFDEARGDMITIKSMELQSIASNGTEVSASFLNHLQFDVMSAIQMAILATVILVLGLFVVRPILTRSKMQMDVSPQLPSANTLSATPPLPLPENSAAAEANFPAVLAQGPMSEVSGSESAAVTENLAAPSLDPVDRLRAMIGDRQEDTVEILRSWLEENEERA